MFSGSNLLKCWCKFVNEILAIRVLEKKSYHNTFVLMVREKLVKGSKTKLIGWYRQWENLQEYVFGLAKQNSPS